jgi:hypothetical protein
MCVYNTWCVSYNVRFLFLGSKFPEHKLMAIDPSISVIGGVSCVLSFQVIILWKIYVK